jgi:hypothetical protein
LVAAFFKLEPVSDSGWLAIPDVQYVPGLFDIARTPFPDFMWK